MLSSFAKMRYFGAALFNLGFALLASITLLGIVFVTRPRQVMHNVRPEFWIPLLVTLVPSYAFGQYLTWKTLVSGETPSPIAIAKRLPSILAPLRLPLAALWLLDFLIGFAIAVSLYKPVPGVRMTLLEGAFIGAIAFCLTALANVYLMLCVRTITRDETVLHGVWEYRYVIDLAMIMAAVVYYRIVLP